MEKNLEFLVDELDSKIYRIAFIDKNHKKLKELWRELRNDQQLLLLASKVVKGKFNEKDTFVSNCLVELILNDYKHVNRGIYEDVVNKIYNSEDLSRIVLNGASNGGYSFLLYTLDNDKIKLTDDQKAFAYNEAMNQPGTERTKNHGPMYSLDVKTCHGVYPYDIRYYILKNNNWSLDEKMCMINEFYADELMYTNLVVQIENDIQCLYDEVDSFVPIDEIIYLSNEDIKLLVGNKNQRNKIIKETTFVKSLRKIRKPNFELL